MGRLFLFGRGLARFSGPHVPSSLLFPMQQVFEGFVTAAVRRRQHRFPVRAQGPMRYLAIDGADRPAFWLKPDIALMERGHCGCREATFSNVPGLLVISCRQNATDRDARCIRLDSNGHTPFFDTSNRNVTGTRAPIEAHQRL